ncbi:hypothetical protein DSM112329_00579 [Paraconexibacter sp. AEG42_29]|uniref:Tat pathway signal sequence domain protein n=1 Tax=Paraconexibacter sp. AEG42_29 TaxID=2997339 RepID=A0AAU7AQB8_9ACTN
MSRRFLAALAAVLVLAAGVVAAVAAVGTGDGAGDARASSGSQVVVRFDKGGGFAGVDVRTRIRGDRRVTVTERGRATRRHTLKAATLTALRKTLDAAELGEKLPGPQGGCADCFVYSITYKGRRVTFDEAAVPGRLKKPLAELSRIARGSR